jgi:hypothetical protein
VTYNATTHVATLDPSANLAAGTEYTATLTGGSTAIRDLANLGLATTSWSFTTAAAAPALPAAPTVSPLGGSFTSAQSVTATAAAGTTIRYTIGTGTTVPADPTASTGTLYAEPVTVSASQIMRFVAFNSAGASPATQAAFTITAGGSDTTVPTVSSGSRTPAHNATGVNPATDVTATFSEAVTPSSVTTATATVRTRSDTGTLGPVVSAVVTYDAAARRVTINPNADLASSQRYQANLTSGITDLAGNRLSSTNASWTFTTGTATTPTNTAPTVTGRTPLASATGVAANSNVTATFSEAVTGVTTTTFTLRAAGATTDVLATVTQTTGTNEWVLNPNADLAANTQYTATLTGGSAAIRDTTNLPLATTSWTFTTAAATSTDTTAPTVGGGSRTPAQSATGVSRAANATAVFSEQVTNVTTANAIVRPFTTATTLGTAVSATVTYNATTRMVTIDPTNTLAANQRYQVNLLNSITDLAGNRLSSTNASWTFTTGA